MTEAECRCPVFRQNGFCWHTDARRMKLQSFRNTRVVEKTPAPPQPVLPRRARRVTPKAVSRMYDFLDLCEELHPGSSGLDQ